MSRCDCPVLVEQRRSALVQVGGCAPLAQRYLPGPATKGGICAANDARLGEHATAADCKGGKEGEGA